MKAKKIPPTIQAKGENPCLASSYIFHFLLIRRKWMFGNLGAYPWNNGGLDSPPVDEGFGGGAVLRGPELVYKGPRTEVRGEIELEEEEGGDSNRLILSIFLARSAFICSINDRLIEHTVCQIV